VAGLDVVTSMAASLPTVATKMVVVRASSSTFSNALALNSLVMFVLNANKKNQQ